METRLKQLDQLHSFVEEVDKDVTLILQNLQWDRKHLLSVRIINYISLLLLRREDGTLKRKYIN